MHVWIAKTTLILGIAAVVAIRAPYGRRSSQIKVVKSKRGRLEIILLSLMWLGSVILPILWVATPLFSFAEYPLYPLQYAAGVVLFSLGLWLFHRAHVDLSTNWSVGLDIRENHTLITSGVYRRLHCAELDRRRVLPLRLHCDVFVPRWAGRTNDAATVRG